MFNSGVEKPGGIIKEEAVLVIKYYCVFSDHMEPRFLIRKERRIKFDYYNWAVVNDKLKTRNLDIILQKTGKTRE